MHTHTRPQRIGTSLQKGQRMVTDKHTYNIRARSLARTHKHTHTHTYCTHTHTHTDTYTFIRILEAETLHFTNEQKF